MPIIPGDGRISRTVKRGVGSDYYISMRDLDSIALLESLVMQASLTNTYLESVVGEKLVVDEMED